MAVSDQLSAPQFQGPNLSSGAKVAEVFGNSNQANTERARADFNNKVTMMNYQYDLNQQALKDSPSSQVEGLTKAGINPLMSNVSSEGFTATASAPENTKNTSKNGTVFDMLKGIGKVADKMSDKAIKLISAMKPNFL